jgi:L-aminopeptidase/D-esterase-like protein
VSQNAAFREEVAGVSGSGLGSCLIVLATDAPLSKRNLERPSQQPLASTADMCWRELT